MFTVCPKCALTLAVTAADLRVGQGYVRCGRCASVFNALAGLHDEPAGGTAPPAERRPATPSAPPPPLMMEVPATPAAGSAADAASELAEFALDLQPDSTVDAQPPQDTMEFALGSADLAQIFVPVPAAPAPHGVKAQRGKADQLRHADARDDDGAGRLGGAHLVALLHSGTRPIMKNPMRRNSIASGLCSGEIASAQRDHARFRQFIVGNQFIVGMTKLAPSLMPEGQRDVTVLVLV